MPTQIEWEGITVTVSYEEQAFGGPYDHIEIRADKPLPITETGYKSHFIHPDELALFDGPEDFVRQWLESQWDGQHTLF